MTSVSTVGELMAYLITQPPDRPIILSGDAEGNSHASLVGVGLAMADAHEVGSYALEIYPTREQVLAPGSDYDHKDDMPPDYFVCVVVLTPVN